jgi:autotransporter passenger strand-loop-strand repeat protein
VSIRNDLVTLPSTLFTSGADDVNLNILSAHQQAAIASGADLYDGLGGNDVVTLPNVANYNESVGNGKTLNWLSGSTFNTGDTTGQRYTINGGDGTYKISLGSGNDVVNIGTGTIEITSAVDQNTTVNFTQPNGTLIIDNPSSFLGTVKGFTTDGIIDIKGIPFDSKGIATLTDGNVLHIQENGKQYVLNVVEQPTKGQTFQLSSDGSGGTDIKLGKGNAGFDVGNFPGLTIMRDLLQKTNLSWAGYYLDAPFYNSQDQYTPWQGNYRALTSQGWNLAPLFVGQQNYSKSPVTLVNVASLADADSKQAIADLSSDGTPKGTVVYLDIEPAAPPAPANANLSLGELAYIAYWCSDVSSAGYFAGIYTVPGEAKTIGTIVPGSPFWIAHTGVTPTVPNGGVILPSPSLSQSGYGTGVQAWQYLINTYSFSPNVSLSDVDLDTFAQSGAVTLVAQQPPIVNQTVSSGNVLSVPTHTAAIATTINGGGVENVSGSDYGSTINDGGYQYVLAGGIATSTSVLDPGIQVVNLHGTADGSTLSGGEQDVYGTATNTNIETSGLQIVEGGGTASGTTINGGTLELKLGAVFTGPATFGAGSGILQIDDLASAPAGVQQTDFKNEIDGFAAGDLIRLEGFGKFSTIDGVAASYDSSSNTTTLTLTDPGSTVATLNLAGDYSADKFTVTNDANVPGAVDLQINNSLVGQLVGQLALTSAAEGIAFPTNTTVATFTDTDTSEAAAAFSATIDWGDGTTTQGVVTGSNGSFTVSGGHTFAEEGSDTATVTITRTSDRTQITPKGTITVADAPITASGVNINATEGTATGTIKVATFTDANLKAVASDFTATVDWGDGTSTAGTVVDQNGTFDVDGTHIYKEEGKYTVGVTIKDVGGSTAITTGNAKVIDAPLTASGASIKSVEGSSTGTVTIATFTDANPYASASDFAATIDWGDGTTAAGTIVEHDGTFEVDGAHTYKGEGKYSVGVSIKDVGGSTASAESTATISDADVLTGKGLSLQAHVGQNLKDVVVAPFEDTYTGNVASDFSATINWGDGATSAGLVSYVAGNITVAGSHTYEAPGHDTVSVTLRDDPPGTASATATSKVTIPHVKLGIKPVDGDNVINYADAHASHGVLITGREKGLVAGETFSVTVTDRNFTKTYTAKVGDKGSWAATIPMVDALKLAKAQQLLQRKSAT